MYVVHLTPREPREDQHCTAPGEPEFVTSTSAGELPRWRTVADGAIVGVVADPDHVIDAARKAVRRGRWAIGIGAGEITAPLGSDDGDATDPTFLAAADAASRASRRRSRAPIVVAGAGSIAAQDAEALFAILAHHWQTRSEAGWQAVAAIEPSDGTVLPQHQAAARLGISQQALSQRLRAAGWAAERGIVPLLRRRLTAAESPRAAPAW